MNKFFNLSDLTSVSPAQCDKIDVVATHFNSMLDFKVNSLSQSVQRFPAPDEVFFLWTVNSFNAFTFIPWLVSFGRSINHLTISTYSINIKIIDTLSHYIASKVIGSIFILISDSANFRIPKVVDHLNQFALSNPGVVQVRYAWNHSKVTLIQSGADHFVIEGSGNFSDNSRHEQYVLLNSRHIFNFRHKWITDEIHGRTS